MNALPQLAIPLVVLVAAWWLTGRVRRYALARRLLDIPNARSSHAVPTPRGGGVAIVLTTLVAFAVAAAQSVLQWSTLVGLAGGGALVAAIGFMDDRRHVRRRWRLLTHLLAAAWLSAYMAGLPPVHVFTATFNLGLVGYPLAALYIVWLINLTNFMDGIDGLTAIEVVTVCLSGAFLYFVTVPPATHWVAPLVLAAATLGFLVWNWPPAKVFLGDSGSGFLGFMLAALSLQAGWAAPELFWSWNILLGVFIVDATVTLVKRAIRGERFYEPHRTHAYQHAAQRWGAHKPVTLLVAAINVLWLLPLAFLVARASLNGPVGMLIAYAPLAAGAVWLGAGVVCPSCYGDRTPPV